MAHEPPVSATDEFALREAATWIQEASRAGGWHNAEYDYEMTCRIRFLLFSVGRDDVGSGYIRVGKVTHNPAEQVLQVLFGSDPSKAPRGINRWGAATEILRSSGSRDQDRTGAFFGFMKSSKGGSVGAMQQELSSEKGSGRHLFEGILNRVDDGRAVATTVSFVSSKDFDLHQYPEAESAALQQLETGEKRAIKQLGGTSELGCARVGGFLSTVLELVNDAVDGKPAPITLCYVFNARHYTATLLSTRAVAQRSIHYVQRKDRKTVEYSQQNLREARFQILGKETRSNSYFEILLGAEGGLRAAPMQISYQPNWWFQVILNLTPSSLHALEAKTSRSSTLPARLNATEASPLPLARNALSASKQQSHHLVNVRESCAALTQ